MKERSAADLQKVDGILVELGLPLGLRCTRGCRRGGREGAPRLAAARARPTGKRVAGLAELGAHRLRVAARQRWRPGGAEGQTGLWVVENAPRDGAQRARFRANGAVPPLPPGLVYANLRARRPARWRGNRRRRQGQACVGLWGANSSVSPACKSRNFTTQCYGNQYDTTSTCLARTSAVALRGKISWSNNVVSNLAWILNHS